MRSVCSSESPPIFIETPPPWLACMEVVENLFCDVSLVNVGHQCPVVPTKGWPVTIVWPVRRWYVFKTTEKVFSLTLSPVIETWRKTCNLILLIIAAVVQRSSSLFTNVAMSTYTQFGYTYAAPTSQVSKATTLRPQGESKTPQDVSRSHPALRKDDKNSPFYT